LINIGESNLFFDIFPANMSIREGSLIILRY
jgi:hypothetical protein